MPKCSIIAHRGHNIDVPEQTMVAFERAIALGAEIIEADVQFTRDGLAVLLHDDTLDRTTSGTGPVAAMDWSEIARLDAGAWFAPEFAGLHVPTLDELFALAEHRNVALCLEAKEQAGVASGAMVARLAREIARRGRLGRDVVNSSNLAALAAAVEAVPGLRIAPDMPEGGPMRASELVAEARAIGARIIEHHFSELTPELVAAVQAEGIEVWAWGPATLAETKAAYDTGATGIMGDDGTASGAVMGTNRH